MQQANTDISFAIITPHRLQVSSPSKTKRVRKKSQVFFTMMALLVTLFTNAQTFDPSEGLKKERSEVENMKPKFGIKAGYNVARLTGSTPDYRPSSKNGFMVAAFYSPAARTGIGYRSEIVFSRQGFGFDESGKQTSVVNDYVYLPQFTTIGLTKFVQLQVGAQIGYLLKSSKKGAENDSEDITAWASRLDYGAAFGAEIYPIKNLIVGGRYNMSMGNAYKQVNASNTTSPIPNPLPFSPADVKNRNAVINLFVGVRF